MRKGLEPPDTLFNLRELDPFMRLPVIVGVGGVPATRREPAEAEDDAGDGGRGRADRADEAFDGGGVDVLLVFEALTDEMRPDDGDPLGCGVPFSFFSGVAGLTLMAEVKLTLSAARWGSGEMDRVDFLA